MSELRGTCPEGHEIVAAVQMIVGHASIAGFNARRLPVYEGHTEVLYDSQESFAETGTGIALGVADDHAEARYRCNGDCGEVTYEQIRFAADREGAR